MGDHKTPRQLIRAALLEAWNADVAAVRKGDLEIIGDDLLAGLTWLFTREPLPTGTAGVVTEAAREAADYLLGLTLYAPDAKVIPAAMSHVMVTLPLAVSMQECIRSLTAALAAATGRGSRAMRKPVQIHTLIGPENEKWQGMMITTAVCDDGTVWQRVDSASSGEMIPWGELPPIPQDTRPTTRTPDADHP